MKSTFLVALFALFSCCYAASSAFYIDYAHNSAHEVNSNGAIDFSDASDDYPSWYNQNYRIYRGEQPSYQIRIVVKGSDPLVNLYVHGNFVLPQLTCRISNSNDARTGRFRTNSGLTNANFQCNPYTPYTTSPGYLFFPSVPGNSITTIIMTSGWTVPCGTPPALYGVLSLQGKSRWTNFGGMQRNFTIAKNSIGSCINCATPNLCDDNDVCTVDSCDGTVFGCQNKCGRNLTCTAPNTCSCKPNTGFKVTNGIGCSYDTKTRFTGNHQVVQCTHLVNYTIEMTIGEDFGYNSTYLELGPLPWSWDLAPQANRMYNHPRSPASWSYIAADWDSGEWQQAGAYLKFFRNRWWAPGSKTRFNVSTVPNCEKYADNQNFTISWSLTLQNQVVGYAHTKYGTVTTTLVKSPLLWTRSEPAAPAPATDAACDPSVRVQSIGYSVAQNMYVRKYNVSLANGARAASEARLSVQLDDSNYGVEILNVKAEKTVYDGNLVTWEVDMRALSADQSMTAELVVSLPSHMRYSFVEPKLKHAGVCA